METNEILTNEELVETGTEALAEIAETGSKNGFKVAAVFGLGTLAGIAICKAAKPVIAKIKARKKPADTVDAEAVVVEDEFEDEFEPEEKSE